ncbi:MAG: diaminopimelate decarboxylase [Clostridiales bacterium]|nr:diaminopimelate decarboxylase [Candidatus Equinaster intestinalis]
MICDNLSVNEKGNLCFAGLDTVDIAKKYGTPIYVMDENKIREKCSIYKKAMKEYFGGNSMPVFASKSLCFKYIYKIIKEENLGIDVVSSGELYTAVQAGFPMENAYFHGNNKTDFDVKFAMDNGIGFFVCDNVYELNVINAEAKSRGIVQKILLRITPGIDPHTHSKISTGNVDSKFGAAIETGQAMELCEFALSKENVKLCGFHCHIGSQIFDVTPFCDAAKIMVRFISAVKEKLGYEAEILNLGGGMGVRYVESDPEINYENNIREIADLVKAECERLNLNMPTVLMEPGRSIVADAGLTLYTVGGRKEIKGFKNYVSVDGGMPDNPRFALYQSAYTVMVANKANEKPDYDCIIAGRCCESGDLLQENVTIPKADRGDVLAVLTTGAYNYAMASNYNAICKPPVLMIKDKKEFVAVRRESFEDLTACQK